MVVVMVIGVGLETKVVLRCVSGLMVVARGGGSGGDGDGDQG